VERLRRRHPRASFLDLNVNASSSACFRSARRLRSSRNDTETSKHVANVLIRVALLPQPLPKSARIETPGSVSGPPRSSTRRAASFFTRLHRIRKDLRVVMFASRFIHVRGKLWVHTFREGAFSALGHDLEFELVPFELDESDGSFRASLDLRTLEPRGGSATSRSLPARSYSRPRSIRRHAFRAVTSSPTSG
jgi:hypothetical protein